LAALKRYDVDVKSRIDCSESEMVMSPPEAQSEDCATSLRELEFASIQAVNVET
jgi:hypothetical protein